MSVRTQSLEETDYAYLAGIIDGEGTITIHRQTDRKRSAYISYGPQISISNTDLTMLESLRNRFGGHIVEAKRRRDGHQKRGYILFFRRGEILALLPRVIQYLTTKLSKAKLLLEYMTTRTRGVMKGTGGRFVRIPLTKRQIEIIAEIRKNNRRGLPI